MDPMTMLAIGAVTAAAEGGAKAYGSYKDNKSSSKATKTSAKEQKRQTLADLLDRALQRRYAANKDARLTQSGIADQRQKALMEMVSGFRDSYK